MRKSNIETLKAWINSQPGIKREAAAEPTKTTVFSPGLNSRQRNAIKWKLKGGIK
jgi:hypothetical protein